MTTTTAAPSIFSLRDLRATRTGQVHRVHFQIDGDSAIVVTDDCCWLQTRWMSRADARSEYARYLRLGFTAYTDEDAAKTIARKVAEIERSEQEREEYKAAMAY